MTMSTATETATCRGCGKVLNGKPYYMGGQAFDPITGKQCPANHYGGFVCSEDCDRRATLELESSMPGCAGQKTPSCWSARTLRYNWPVKENA